MHDVFGIGFPLMDIVVRGDNIITNMNLVRGGMHLIDSQKLASVMSEIEYTQFTPGGSCANTVSTLAEMGAKCGFAGCVGDDGIGKQYIELMRESGVEPFLKVMDGSTGTVISLISKDFERTMLTHLGAALKLNSTPVFSSKIVHFTGYLSSAADAALSIKHERISFDVADKLVIQSNREFIEQMIQKSFIVFANEEEALALTNMKAADAAKELSKNRIAVVKVGEKGSYIARNGIVIRIDAVKTEVVDTTGAGDAYAAGFLYGLSKGMPLDECGMLGAKKASEVISVIGARFGQ